MRTPALRNAFTSASTRLSFTRARTRSIRADVVDRVEARLDVRVQHPPVALGAEEVDLGDRVLGPPLGPEPVGDRLEVGLEDRFQHQLQRRLDDPVGDGRECRACAPSPTRPAWGSSAPAPAAAGTCPPSAADRRSSRNPGTPTNSSTSATVRPSTPGVFAPLVARDPVERHQQRRRVVHEVEQVVEPAAGIGRRPTVKLGLHLRYPPTRPHRAAPARRRHSAARLSALQPPSLLDTAAALPHVHGLSPARSTTAAPPRPGPIGRR